MRHYIWYDSTGRLGASMDVPGGWIGKDLSDPDESDQHLQDVRNRFLQNGFEACFPQDCSCEVDDYSCQCPLMTIEDYFWTGTELQLKHEISQVIDNIAIPNLGELDKPAGSWIAYKLTSPTAPDSMQVQLKDFDGAPILGDQSPVILTFLDGETNTVLLSAPALGLKGRIIVMDPRTRVMAACFRGT